MIFLVFLLMQEAGLSRFWCKSPKDIWVPWRTAGRDLSVLHESPEGSTWSQDLTVLDRFSETLPALKTLCSTQARQRKGGRGLADKPKS